MEGELYPGEFEQMERNGRMDAIADIPTITIPVEDYMKLLDAIPIDCIGQIKAELTKSYGNDNPKNFTYTTVKLKEVLYIIDKYTKEHK